MTSPRLTDPAKAATIAAKLGRSVVWRCGLGAWPLMGAMTLGACVSVQAPDEPIVIELNVNIKQEVVYRLAEDAGNTIQQNPEIF